MANNGFSGFFWSDMGGVDLVGDAKFLDFVRFVDLAGIFETGLSYTYSSSSSSTIFLLTDFLGGVVGCDCFWRVFFLVTGCSGLSTSPQETVVSIWGILRSLSGPFCV